MKLTLRRALLLYTLVPVVSVFLIFAAENIISTHKHERDLIESHMTDLAQAYVQIFNGYLVKVSEQADILADLIMANPDITEAEIYQLLEQNVRNSRLVHGMTVAFVPHEFDGRRRLFSPHVFRKGEQIKQMDIAEKAYDYTEYRWEWWHKPVDTAVGSWTEPYFDEGAGNIMMSTYSVPFFRDGKIRGVAAVDIPLHRLNEETESLGIKKYKIFLLSWAGKVLMSSNDEDIGKPVNVVIEERYQEVLRLLGRKKADIMREELIVLRNDMLSGREGKRTTRMALEDQDFWYFYAPIKAAGWSAAIGVNETRAFAHVYERALYLVVFFSLLLLLLTLFIILSAGKLSGAFEWILGRCQRIERMNFQPAGDKDLKIEEIRQLSKTLDNMCAALNTHFTTQDKLHQAQVEKMQVTTVRLPEINGYQLSAWSSGDKGQGSVMYDVFELPHANKSAFLLISDSDKGSEAIVKYTQLRAIFRTSLLGQTEATEIVDRMNAFLIADSELHGVVQLWMGVLDSPVGAFRIVNIGHNTIYHFSKGKNRLQRIEGNNLALRIRKNLVGLSEQALQMLAGDVLLVASEGLLTALNKDREVFSLERLETIIRENHAESAGQLIQRISENLEAFTQGAYIQAECALLVLKRDD